MNRTQYCARRLSRKIGPLTNSRALLSLRGPAVALPSRPGLLRPAAHSFFRSLSARVFYAVFSFAVLLALLPVSAASADSRIGGPNTFPGLLTPGGLDRPGAIAVSAKEGGDLYVIDGHYNQRVSEFTPAGAFVRAFGWGIVPGAAAGRGDLTAGSTSITHATTTSGSFNTGQNGAGMIIAGAGIPADDEITEVTSTGIGLTEPATATATGVALTATAGPGNVPTNEVQRLAIDATGGQFKLTFKSPEPGSTTDTTAPLDYDAGAAEVQAALEGLANIGPGNVSVSGGPGDAKGTTPYLIEFKGRYADTNVRHLFPTDLSLSGASPSSEAELTTPTEGGGALETCTTACVGASAEEGNLLAGNGFGGSQPGQLNESDEIAIDNDPSSGSFGDVYVLDQRNYRVEKYSPAGEFLLMFGGGVDHTTGADLCTEADLQAGDSCGAGVPGSAPAHFSAEEPSLGAKWNIDGDNSIAVGPEGTVYVGDYGRIQEFEPGGSYKGEFTLSLKAGEQPQFVTALALDSAGDIFERSATFGAEGLASQVPGIREYSPAHLLLHTFDAGPEEAGSEPTHIALGQGGDLFASELHDGEALFRAFRPTGALFAEFTSPQVHSQAEGLALASATETLYATASSPEGAHVALIPSPQPGPPIVTDQHPTDIGHTTATLHATVNPKQFDTHYRLQYVAAEKFAHTEWAEAEQTPQIDLGSVDRPDPVQAPISNLTKGTDYRFRVLAESECEPTSHPGHICLTEGERSESGVEIPRSFETLPPVSVRSFTTQTVGPELVKLKAELNPNDSATPTSYTIHYGTEEGDYSSGSTSGTLGLGSSFEPVTATFSGLQPNTTYHYQLTAENESGDVKTPDQTFTTELSTAEEHAAENCPNANLREENNSLSLPDCRAYEQVSPASKNGFAVGVSAASPTHIELSGSGEGAAFETLGGFAGASAPAVTLYYSAHRTADGWSTDPALAYPAGPDQQPVSFFGFNSELDRWLFSVQPGSTYETASAASTSASLYLGSSESSFLKATPTLTIQSGEREEHWFHPVAESADLSHIFFASRVPLLSTDERPGGYITSDGADRIYAAAGAGGSAPTLSLLAEVPLDLTSGTCEVDTSLGLTAPRWASSDGSTLFYTDPVASQPGATCEDGGVSGVGGPNKAALFARTGTASPVELSAPPPSQCHSPHPCADSAPELVRYDGASPSGSLAWFTTSQPLVDSDTDGTTDLYLAKLENGEPKELVQASSGDPTDPTPGKGAGVQGVVGLSEDGTHAAFVATGVLTTQTNSAGAEALQGADNLYLYDATSGETKFVARLCSGPEESGSVADPACDASLSSSGTSGAGIHNDRNLWSGGAAEAQLTPDGRYLLFASYGRLTPDKTSNTKAIFRYDFETGQLIRVSIGRRGNDGDGNDDAYPARLDTDAVAGQIAGSPGQLAGAAERSISADGSTVVFETAAPLVSRDTNAGAHPGCGSSETNVPDTGCDIYQWQESGHGTCREAGGCISLISDGTTAQGATQAVISSSGRDVAFLTPAGLVPGDTDGVADVYDAREGGGFSYTPPPIPCGGNEVCHHEPSLSPSPPRITTEGETGGNGSHQLQCAKGKVRVEKHGQVRCVAKKSHKAKHHKKHKRAGHNGGGAK